MPCRERLGRLLRRRQPGLDHADRVGVDARTSSHPTRRPRPAPGRSWPHGNAGVECWDWMTLAPCTGGDYDAGGWLSHDVEGAPLPWAYGTAFDGSCVLGLGDPGLVFSVDPKGSSPCSSLGAATRTLDLRKQRCDGGVGRATWSQASLQDATSGELTSVVAHRPGRRQRPGARHEGHLERPARPQRDRRQRPSGDHRCRDREERARRHGVGRRGAAAHPGRLARRPQAVVLRDDDAAGVRGRARVGEGDARRRLRDPSNSPSRPTGCLAPAPPPVPEVKRATDLVLGCSDRRVVLEDVFIEGKKVRLLGVAAREFAGRKVPVVFGATGKTVARPRSAPTDTSPPPPPCRRRSCATPTRRAMSRRSAQRPRWPSSSRGACS